MDPTHADAAGVDASRVDRFVPAHRRVGQGRGRARDGAGKLFRKRATFWEDWGDRDARGLLIAPDSAGGGDCDLDYMELGKWALPQDDETLEELVRMGRRDAERWVERGGRGATSPARMWTTPWLRDD